MLLWRRSEVSKTWPQGAHIRQPPRKSGALFRSLEGQNSAATKE